MKRRDLAILAGAALLTPPFVSIGRTAMPTVGILSSTEPSPVFAKEFRAGLADTGYAEGRNLQFDHRSADGRYERLAVLAAELVRRGVAVIYAGGNAAARAAKLATSTIPIVFTTGDDPVAIGLVPSLSRPGGNITGASFIAGALPMKRLELLHETVPAAKTIAMLINPVNANARLDSNSNLAAARALGLRLLVVTAASDSEFETLFDTLDREGARALLVNSDSFLTSRNERLVTLAAQHRIPAISSFRSFAAAGGLMSYGGNFAETFHQAGLYVGRILAGASPADLPVVQSATTELVVNLKTARKLGLTIPPSILARADEVIE